MPIYSDTFLLGDLLKRRCDAGAGEDRGRSCKDDSDCAPGTCLWDYPGHCDSNSPNAGTYCTSDALCAPGSCVDETHWEPCPICNPDTLKCNGGPNDGDDCTPQSPEIGPAYPTSLDCLPPPPWKVATMHFSYKLTTGLTSTEASNGQFCGYCRDADTLCFDGDPDLYPSAGENLCPDSALIPDCEPFSFHHGVGGSIDGCGPLAMIRCDSDTDCYAPYDTCQQRDPGAFDEAGGTRITMWGSPAGNISDRAPHEGTISGAFCTPASFSSADGNASLPGPGAASFPGTFKLRP